MWGRQSCRSGPGTTRNDPDAAVTADEKPFPKADEEPPRIETEKRPPEVADEPLPIVETDADVDPAERIGSLATGEPR